MNGVFFGNVLQYKDKRYFHLNEGCSIISLLKLKTIFSYEIIGRLSSKEHINKIEKIRHLNVHCKITFKNIPIICISES